MLRPDRNARQRSPSSLGSNSQPAREKGSSTSVASIGATHFGRALLRSLTFTLGGNSSSRFRLAI